MKKRLFSLLLVLALMLTMLAGCGAPTTSSEPPSTETGTNSTEAPSTPDAGGSTPTEAPSKPDAGGSAPVETARNDTPTNGVETPNITAAPSGGGSSDSNGYYIGGNGSIDLYAWLPEAMYDDLYAENEDGGFIAAAEYSDSGTQLSLLAVIASGDYLQEAIDEAKAEYSGDSSSDADVLFSVLRDNYVAAELGDDFPGAVDEGYLEINGVNWRYYEAYAEVDDEGADLALLFWMEGGDMVLVMVIGVAEGSGSFDAMTDTLAAVVTTLRLDK